MVIKYQLIIYMDEQGETKKGLNLTLVLIAFVVLAGVGLVSIKAVRHFRRLAAARAMNETAMQAAPTPQAETTAVLSDQQSSVSVEAGSFYYKPNMIQVKKGTSIKLTLNSVSMMHDFNIDELNVHVPITKKGESTTIEFTADKVGTFEYYCSVGKHRQLGQVGKLVVTE